MIQAATRLLRRLIGSNLAMDEERFWRGQTFAFQSSSGETVTADSAMRLSTVYACVRVLSETLAVMPCKTYRRLANGGRVLADTHPIYDVLHKQPNQWQTAFEWFEMMQAHVLLRGNAYSEIIPGKRGAVDQLIPLHPDRMKVMRLDNGRLRYEYTEPNGKTTPYAQDEIFHLRGMSSDGLTGTSPIGYAADTIGLAKAAETHGAALFKNGAVLGLPLSTDKPMAPKQAKEIADAIRKEHSGSANHFKTYVLPFGLKPTQLGVTNVDAQFLETRKLQREDIAAIFRIPQHMVGILDHATFSNIEHQAIQFIRDTMLPWLSRWEQAINRDLIPEEEYYAEFMVENLLRGDSAARSQYMTTMIQNGLMTINEARAKDNMDPVGPAGDKLYFPLNYTTIDKVGQEPPKPETSPIGGGSPEEEDKPEDEKPPMDEEPEANSILKAVLRDTVRRMARMEKEAVLRASKKDNFLEAVEGWYTEHKARLAEAIEPPFEFLTKEDADKWAGEYCEARIVGMLKLSECMPSELASKVETYADGIIGNAIAQVDGWLGVTT